MRDGWKSRWGWRVSAVVLVGGLLVLGTGNVVTQAGERDDDHNQRNPFEQILHKLDKILDAIKGGGGQEGNHTLRWDTNHPSASRFTTAFPGAVLDKNTGLVWEQAPDATVRVWSSISQPLGARNYCVNKNVGGTRGWRLPSMAELESLIDPTLPAPFVRRASFLVSCRPTIGRRQRLQTVRPSRGSWLSSAMTGCSAAIRPTAAAPGVCAVA